MSRICPDCNNKYSSKFDICDNCYKKLVEQFTEEAKSEMTKYDGKDYNEWSIMYRCSVNDLLIYGEDDFRNESKKSNEEQLLYYFTKRYVKEKIREHCEPIRKKREKAEAEQFKQLLIRVGIYDEMKEAIRQRKIKSKESK